MLRIESIVSEVLDHLLVNQFGKVFVIYYFYLLYFMRCSETVEEVKNRNTGLDSRKVGDSRQVHYFLYGA